jgi:hypothetical protein
MSGPTGRGLIHRSADGPYPTAARLSGRTLLAIAAQDQLRLVLDRRVFERQDDRDGHEQLGLAPLAGLRGNDVSSGASAAKVG